MNIVILSGKVGINPEIIQFENNKVATFTLATSRVYKDVSGEWHELTEWHFIVVPDRLVERVRKFVFKGSTVNVVGEIKYKEWKAEDGSRRNRTEIHISQIEYGTKPVHAVCE